ncbi:hypothetical protein [Sphingobium algorifonticola]|uniref:Uncharacterized protein n=1 Tax=Sphingobium algorifonticola TaxID=2008318 RepID=A0A437J756_9SPHN|nr:hypothetical protein [Sphingobium algorifonticola]RVT40846.1 hypothetical protein ENE74_10240 [Sphingobium algorifonticola]
MTQTPPPSPAEAPAPDTAAPAPATPAPPAPPATSAPSNSLMKKGVAVGAAVGIGSAAIVAALLYTRRR